MAIKGQQINVTLDPRAYKELNPLENRIPTHMDLRNGHYTDAKYWERRPGFLEVVTLVPLEDIDVPPVVEPPPVVTECESVCPVGHFAVVTYDGSETIGGPAIRVRAISTPERAFLVTATYFPVQHLIKIQWYDGESNQELGTVLETVAYTLSNGDELEIQAGARIADVIQFYALVNGEVVAGPVGNAGISESASCATFFALDLSLSSTTEFITVDGLALTIDGQEITVTTL
jgi:hypothetical protein